MVPSPFSGEGGFQIAFRDLKDGRGHFKKLSKANS